MQEPASTVDLPDFFSHDDDALNRLVALVDPALRYVDDLDPDASTYRTLVVDQHGTRRILKIRRISSNMWDDTYFQLEVLALRRVEERNLSGVTRMVHHYCNDWYEAILKTFVAGTPGNRLDTDALLRNREFIGKLDALYLKLHLAGIAKIKFLPRKVIIGDDGELTLVDLSTCVVNTEYGIGRFVREVRDDSRFITRLEKNAMS